MVEERVVERLIQSIANEVDRLQGQSGTLTDRIYLSNISDELQMWLDSGQKGNHGADLDLLIQYSIEVPPELRTDIEHGNADSAVSMGYRSSWQTETEASRAKAENHQLHNNAIVEAEPILAQPQKEQSDVVDDLLNGEQHCSCGAGAVLGDLKGFHREGQLASRGNLVARSVICALESQMSNSFSVEICNFRRVIRSTVPKLEAIAEAQLKLREIIDSGIVPSSEQLEAEALLDEAESVREKLLEKIGQVATAKYLEDADKEVDALQALMDAGIFEFFDQTAAWQTKTGDALANALRRRVEKRREKASTRMETAKRALGDGAPQTAINLLNEGLQFLKEKDGRTFLPGVHDLSDELYRYLDMATEQKINYDKARECLGVAARARDSYESLVLTRQAFIYYPKYPGLESLLAQLSWVHVTGQIEKALEWAESKEFEKAETMLNEALADMAHVDMNNSLFKNAEKSIHAGRERVREKHRKLVSSQRVEMLLKKAESAVSDCVFIEAEDLLSTAERILQTSSLDEFDLPLRVASQRQILEEARTLFQDLGMLIYHYTHQSAPEEQVHLLSKILRHPSESDAIRKIQRRALELQFNKSLLEGDEKSMERLTAQWVIENRNDPIAWRYWNWLRAKQHFDEIRLESKESMQQEVENFQKQSEDLRRDAMFWRLLSGAAAIAAFAMLVYAFVFLLEWQEPLSYLTVLPGILSAVAAKFVHDFYIRGIESLSTQRQETEERLMSYQMEQRKHANEFYSSILSDIQRPPFSGGEVEAPQ